MGQWWTPRLLIDFICIRIRIFETWNVFPKSSQLSSNGKDFGTSKWHMLHKTHEPFIFT
jgi:hypothetical protein